MYGVDFRASIDDTGNDLHGGDWLMETDTDYDASRDYVDPLRILEYDKLMGVRQPIDLNALTEMSMDKYPLHMLSGISEPLLDLPKQNDVIAIAAEVESPQKRDVFSFVRRIWEKPGTNQCHTTHQTDKIGQDPEQLEALNNYAVGLFGQLDSLVLKNNESPEEPHPNWNNFNLWYMNSKMGDHSFSLECLTDFENEIKHMEPNKVHKSGYWISFKESGDITHLGQFGDGILGPQGANGEEKVEKLLVLDRSISPPTWRTVKKDFKYVTPEHRNSGVTLHERYSKPNSPV